jgi:predicted PurR-regulated permease PerM
MNQKVEISSKTIVFTVFFLIFLKILWQIRELIFSLFLAFVFMSALKPLVKILEKRKIPRSLAVIFVFFISLLAFSFLGFFVLPPLLKESLLFLKNLPPLINNIFPILSFYLNTDSLTQFLPDLTQNFVKIISAFFSNFIFLVSIIFFTFYFLLEEDYLKKFLDKFLEEKQAGEINAVFDKAEQRMSAWVWGELILMIVVGTMSYIGLSLLHVRYALPLAIIAGLLEVVPVIGPTISTVPAFFVAVPTSWFLALSVIALYFLIQQLENNIIVPLVMKKTIGLNPIITLVALTIGGKVGGFFGMLLSIPLALLIETILIELTKIKKREL